MKFKSISGIERQYPVSCCKNIYESDIVKLAKSSTEEINQKLEDCYSKGDIYRKGALKHLKSLLTKTLSKEVSCFVGMYALDVLTKVDSPRFTPRDGTRHF